MFRKSIFKLMNEEKWDKVRDRLAEILDDENENVNLSSSSRSLRGLSRQLSSVDMMGQNALHRCLWSHPPVDVVESIINYDHRYVKTADFLGQSPLHISILGHCTIDVVERLIEIYPGAAFQVEDESRTPLHFAALKQASIEIVATLCLAAPSTTRLVDKRGQTPLALAKKFKASESVIHLLEEFTETYADTLEKTELSLERLQESGKIVLPRNGITEATLIKMVNESFDWKKGKALTYFHLETPKDTPKERRGSAAWAA